MELPDIDRQPDNAYAHKKWAEWYWKRGEYGRALAHTAACVTLKPSAGASLLYGTMSMLLGRLDDAETHLGEVVRRAPDCGQAHMNLAHLHLLRGDLATGFREIYEVREKFLDLYPVRIESKVPLWTGQDLAGKCLQLSSWEGAGDSIQFVRYAAVVKEKYPAARVEVLCPPALKLLFETCRGVDHVWTVGDDIKPGDYFANTLNLPYLCGTKRTSDIPGAHDLLGPPYLRPDSERVQQWRERLGLRDGRRRVAICWQGNPKHINDAMRSIPADNFLALDQADVQLFSVQKDATDVPARVTALDGLEDFADTAAVLWHMDLTITVDTSIAHLAGALGLPVWIALAKSPDWRWMMDRTDSPWYPSARLFRQQVAGQWDSVFIDMTNNLRSEVRKVA